jgi:hypothetical protein
VVVARVVVGFLVFVVDAVAVARVVLKIVAARNFFVAFLLYAEVLCTVVATDNIVVLLVVLSVVLKSIRT